MTHIKLASIAALFTGLLIAPDVLAAPTRTLDAQQITNGSATLTLPSSTDTLTGRATSDTLTNKVISGSANTISNVPAASLTGTVPIANGGTGATTQSGAANAILPAQTGAAGQFLTSDGTNVSFASIPTASPTIIGSKASPQAITAAGGIPVTPGTLNAIAFVVGSGGAVSVTASSQIAGCTTAGQRLTVIGESATNTVTLSDGNGLSLNGAWVGGLNSALGLVCDSGTWVETHRR